MCCAAHQPVPHTATPSVRSGMVIAVVGSLNHSGRERKNVSRFLLELLPWLAEDTVGSTESPGMRGTYELDDLHPTSTTRCAADQHHVPARRRRRVASKPRGEPQ